MIIKTLARQLLLVLVWQSGCQSDSAAVLRGSKGYCHGIQRSHDRGVLKRLKAAVGYHELGMTQHALRCLDSLASLGEIGPFGLVTDVPFAASSSGIRRIMSRRQRPWRLWPACCRRRPGMRFS